MTLLYVTVGTDHHRFDRLMDWLEPWIERHPEVRCIVQHGSSRTPAGAECHTLLPYDRAQELFHEADIVLCQGGPGSMVDARTAGRLPIMVPRHGTLGEAVDDHQVRFAERMAELGKVVYARNAEELADQLDRALAEPDGFKISPDEDRTGETVARFGELVAELVARPRRWRRVRK